MRDEDDQVSGASTIIRDISERKKTEKFILDSLREKDVLLREIHHRVKNNLSIVSSLLYLQSTRSADRMVTGLFQEAQNRIRSMSLVHETLYTSDNLAAVDFGVYVVTLARTLFRTYGVSEAHVRLVTDVASVCLPIEQAIPCGLIANELLSNALKHAFPNQGGGTITLSLHVHLECECVFSVRDDGAGLGTAAEASGPACLGLSLVRALASQLDGKFELLNSDPGTDARLSFNLTHDTSTQ